MRVVPLHILQVVATLIVASPALAWQTRLLRTAAPQINLWGGSPDIRSVIELWRTVDGGGFGDAMREQVLMGESSADAGGGRRMSGWESTSERIGMRRGAPTVRAPTVHLCCASAAVAAVIIREGDDSKLAQQLTATLAASGMAVVRVESAALGLAVPGLCAVFELSADGSSMGLMHACAEHGHDLYRWQPSVAMFKRLCGEGGGPAWVASSAASAVSEDIVTDERGWGYLSGDEEKVVDTAAMTNEELSALLQLPLHDGDDSTSHDGDNGDEWPAPHVSALGYSLLSVRAEELGRTAAALTPTARRVLLHKGTEAPGTSTLADATALPPRSARGTFISPLSGAPLFLSSQRRTSTSGWLSFAAQPASATAQHLGWASDLSAGTPRVECIEASSGAHLGHAFGNELCINAAALLFIRESEAVPSSLPRPAAPAIDRLLAERPSLLGCAHVATLSGGCFWALRPALAALPGVHCALAGFCGGDAPCPSYERVSSGESGHVEAVQLAFDPTALAYADLLAAFWRLVPEPNSTYRQGPDVGAQYESCVFYHSGEQRDEALRARAALQEQLGCTVATRVRHAQAFCVAGAEHQR